MTTLYKIAPKTSELINSLPPSYKKLLGHCMVYVMDGDIIVYKCLIFTKYLKKYREEIKENTGLKVIFYKELMRNESELY